MADTFIAFPPDSTDPNAKRVVFNQNTIPGISGNVYYQYVRQAQPPTYTVCADNSQTVSGKIHLCLYNSTPVRLRIEHIYAHPHSVAASGTNIVLQVMATLTEPTNGTDVAIRKLATDFVDNPAPPNNVIVKAASTVVPLSGYFLGGGIVNTHNGPTIVKQTATLYKKDIDHSSIQLLSGQGVLVRQSAPVSTSGGTISTYITFTLDTA